MRAAVLRRRVSTPLWSVIVLFTISVVIAVAAYFAAVHSFQASQASQQRQGQRFERKLCTTLDGLASRKPPPGPVADNPSRAYLQWLHDQLSQLGPDVGCKGAP